MTVEVVGGRFKQDLRHATQSVFVVMCAAKTSNMILLTSNEGQI